MVNKVYDYKFSGIVLFSNNELSNWELGLVFTEVEPISTYVDFGEREFLVADERGYEHLLHKMAETFLLTSEGKIMDNRLKLNKVTKKSFYLPKTKTKKSFCRFCICIS